jgi:nickel transport protein
VVTSQEQGDYSSHIDVAVVQKIVEDALDEKLAPVKRMLVEAQDKGPQLSEVVAGVGYIFGLFGLLAYWKSRKKVSGE